MTPSILYFGMRPRLTAALTLAVSSLLATGAVAMADDPLPKAVPASKYAKMAARSPFAPPTAVAVQQATPPPPAAPGWADSLSATMIMQDGNKYMVTVLDSANAQQHLYLTTEPDALSQMAVDSIKWGATRDEAPTIILRKGNEKAKIRYESGSGATGGPNGIGAPVVSGTGRMPLPPIPGVPGAAAFRPLGTQPNGGPSTAVRRPLIRSQPQPVPRPGINAPVNGVRPNPAAKPDDDDDDD